MYNQPFYIPGYYSSTIPSMMRGASMMPTRALTGAATATKGAGLFGKLGNAFGALRAINWGGLINNTSKTLGIINQTIPLVRQVGPMVGNMRSMMKLASAFKDETDSKPTLPNNTTNQNTTSSQNNYIPNNSNIDNNTSTNQNTKPKKESYTPITTADDSPTFFIN